MQKVFIDLIIVCFVQQNKSYYRNASKEVLCSNRGNCICGECQCHSRQNAGEIISGKYCECDTFSCARDINGLSCGGPHKGVCCDGECYCEVFRLLFL
jgi:hypothetical protein